MLSPSFDIDKIKFATDKQTYERAINLYENGKVTEFKEGIGSYSAVVLGTKPYIVSVEARRYGLASCDCYLGQKDTLCKHMVAVSIYAVLNGKKLKQNDREIITCPKCSGNYGELLKDELLIIKKSITAAMRYIRPYSGPSRTWFDYQDSLIEGVNRLSAIISKLPVSKQAAELLVKLLLRLDKKLCTGRVDDSDGTVGSFMRELVGVLQEYARLDDLCISAFEDVCGAQTCFDWAEPLIKIVDEGFGR